MSVLKRILTAGAVLVMLFSWTGCQQPVSNNDPQGVPGVGISGCGNGVNGGGVCADGAGGIYFTHPSEDGLMHRDASGTVKRIGSFTSVSQLSCRDSVLYFYGETVVDEEVTASGLYRYDGGVPTELVGGYIPSLAVGDKLYYTDGTGLISADLEGHGQTRIKEGNIRQIALQGGRLYTFEVSEETGQGSIFSCDLTGGDVQTPAAVCSGGMNVTDQGIYYLGNEGIFYLEHGQKAAKQLIFADGVRGLNATADGVYYISTSLGEPSLNLYSGKQSSTVIPPSVLGELESGPFVVEGKIYFVSGGVLQRADLSGANPETIALE